MQYSTIKRVIKMDNSYNNELSGEEAGHAGRGIGRSPLTRKPVVRKHNPCPVCGFGRLLDSRVGIIADICVASSSVDYEKNGWEPDAFTKCPRCKTEFGYRLRSRESYHTNRIGMFEGNCRLIFFVVE